MWPFLTDRAVCSWPKPGYWTPMYHLTFERFFSCRTKKCWHAYHKWCSSWWKLSAILSAIGMNAEKNIISLYLHMEQGNMVFAEYILIHDFCFVLRPESYRIKLEIHSFKFKPRWCWLLNLITKQNYIISRLTMIASSKTVDTKLIFHDSLASRLFSKDGGGRHGIKSCKLQLFLHIVCPPILQWPCIIECLSYFLCISLLYGFKLY